MRPFDPVEALEEATNLAPAKHQSMPFRML